MRFVAICLCCSLFAPASADDQPKPKQPKPKQPKAVSDHWLKESRTMAESFVMAPAAEGAKPFALHEKAVFRHTQSVRGDDIGAVHLWSGADGRPAVIGVVFFWTDSKTTRRTSYEFHSLWPEPVTMRKDGRTVWTSKTPGFRWKPFPEGTPAPADSKLKQRLQGKRLARMFTANTTTGDDQKWELRRVPTALHDYEATEAGVTHGAIYAFCQGTDTEVVLLIEAHRPPDAATAKARWRYTLVPFTDYKARVKFREREIWESAAGQLNENGKPHFWGLLDSPKPPFEVE